MTPKTEAQDDAGSRPPFLALPASVVDSRRLTGPNIFSDREGAVLDVVPPNDGGATIERWRAATAAVTRAIGWSDPPLEVREYPGGASLFIGAPVDALYAATEINEWAWIASENRDAMRGIGEVASRFWNLVATERFPALIALRDAAAAHGVSFVLDDESISVGSGAGSRTFELLHVPSPSAINWDGVYDVPIALVSGSNGKTTTTRLVAAMATAAGHSVGACDTDGVRIDGELVAHGDYAGPAGARLVARDGRVEMAVLETARGGILRRGLAVRRARTAIVTNVAADHLGEYGIHDLRSLGEAKLVVARAVDAAGRVVLNADDVVLRSLADRVRAPITWYSLDAGSDTVRAHRARGGDACIVRDGAIVMVRGGVDEEIVRVADVVLARGGTARHNIENAIGAVALAAALGVPSAAIARTLRTFGRDDSDNPGRMVELEIGGVRVVVDFAHNPDGIAVLFAATAHIQAARRLLLLGQAGDRDDGALRALAAEAWRHRPDHIVLKEMDKYLRGRLHGETTAVMKAELTRLGAPHERVSVQPTEMDGVRDVLGRARGSDLLLLTVHSHYDDVVSYLRRLRDDSWVAGEPLP